MEAALDALEMLETGEGIKEGTGEGSIISVLTREREGEERSQELAGDINLSIDPFRPSFDFDLTEGDEVSEERAALFASNSIAFICFLVNFTSFPASLKASSLAARCSSKRSSKDLLLPQTLLLKVNEWVLQVKLLVHSLSIPSVFTPQCLSASYCLSLQGRYLCLEWRAPDTDWFLSFFFFFEPGEGETILGDWVLTPEIFNLTEEWEGLLERQGLRIERPSTIEGDDNEDEGEDDRLGGWHEDDMVTTGTEEEGQATLCSKCEEEEVMDMELILMQSPEEEATSSLAGEEGVNEDRFILDIWSEGSDVLPPVTLSWRQREEEEDEASDLEDKGGVSMFDNILSFRTRFPCLNSVQFNRVNNQDSVKAENRTNIPMWRLSAWYLTICPQISQLMT